MTNQVESADSWVTEEQIQFESLICEISTRFIRLDSEEIDGAIDYALQRVCEYVGVDISSVWQWTSDDTGMLILTHMFRQSEGPMPPPQMPAVDEFPWAWEQVMRGLTSFNETIDDLPAEAVRDRKSWEYYGLKTSLRIPLAIGSSKPFGAITFNDTDKSFEWSEVLVSRLKIVAQIIANALARKKAYHEMRLQDAHLSLAADSAQIGLWSLDLDSMNIWSSDRGKELFGLAPDVLLSFETFLSMVHPDDQARLKQAVHSIRSEGKELSVDYRVDVPGKGERWMRSLGRCQPPYAQITGIRLMGVTIDKTEDLLAQQQLEEAFEEIQQLRDQLHNENLYLKEQVLARAGHRSILGESEPVRRMLSLVRKVAPTDSAVLILGETGTGKELLAQAIHDASSRKARTMIMVNCAALPPTLIESELFGREKGAYTGAMTRQVGRFEMADGSTLFLDEIGDLPLDLQAKLLRVLQDGQFERLGSSQTIHTNIRLIAATNRDLAALMKEGKFREDLFHRLNVFPIEVPPLRNRITDIPLLVWNFISEFNVKMGRSIESVPKPVMEELKQYPWSGNVRELRNVIERAMILSDSNCLQVEIARSKPGNIDEFSTLEAVESAHIVKVLERTHWRVSGANGAAQILGLLPTTLHSRMKKLGISRPSGTA